MWTVMQLEEGAEVDNIPRFILHIIRKANAVIVLLFIQKFSTSLQNLHADFLQNFGLFPGSVSGHKLMFFLADTSQKLDN